MRESVPLSQGKGRRGTSPLLHVLSWFLTGRAGFEGELFGPPRNLSCQGQASPLRSALQRERETAIRALHRPRLKHELFQKAFIQKGWRFLCPAKDCWNEVGQHAKKTSHTQSTLTDSSSDDHSLAPFLVSIPAVSTPMDLPDSQRTPRQHNSPHVQATSLS